MPKAAFWLLFCLCMLFSQSLAQSHMRTKNILSLAGHKIVDYDADANGKTLIVATETELRVYLLKNKDDYKLVLSQEMEGVSSVAVDKKFGEKFIVGTKRGLYSIFYVHSEE